MSTQADKAQRFQALHARSGAFVIPNPWDAGSAKILERLGYEALASTSAGYAFSLGRLDGQVGRDEMIEHCRQLCAATSLPVSADLENGYAEDPQAAAQTLVLGAEAGLVGGSIEDYSGDPARPIYDFALAVERVQAAVEAVAKLPFKFMFAARAENLLHGVNDLDDTIRRLQALRSGGRRCAVRAGPEDARGGSPGVLGAGQAGEHQHVRPAAGHGGADRRGGRATHQHRRCAGRGLRWGALAARPGREMQGQRAASPGAEGAASGRGVEEAAGMISGL
jgi:hypothetical protein